MELIGAVSSYLRGMIKKKDGRLFSLLPYGSLFLSLDTGRNSYGYQLPTGKILRSSNSRYDRPGLSPDENGNTLWSRSKSKDECLMNNENVIELLEVHLLSSFIQPSKLCHIKKILISKTLPSFLFSSPSLTFTFTFPFPLSLDKIK